MVLNWEQIRVDYITNESASYRKLAKKYGVSYTAVGDKARAEGWLKEREHYQTKTLSKTIAAVSKRQASRATRLQAITDKLLSKIERAVDDLEMREIMTDKGAIRQITGALKDIKDIQMIKSEADIREQEARIRGLERQIEDDVGAQIDIIFADGTEELAR